MTWATRDEARATWPDAVGMPDPVLDRLLDAAFEQCSAFAPPLPDGAVVPARYREANILQARELWQAAHRDGDLVGFETYAVRVRPLSATVQALLRPHTGVPVVG